MNTRNFTAILVGVTASFALAKDDDARVQLRGGGKAEEVVKAHVRSFFEGDFATMANNYAASVTLLPGHEMLKEEYGLAGRDGRKEGAVVKSAKLRKAMEEAFGGRPLMPKEKIDRVFEVFEFTPLDTKLGDNALEPPDPVDTPDGKLHFTLREGDVLFKVGPKKGDFLLFQFRKVEGAWKVVAEYLD